LRFYPNLQVAAIEGINSLFTEQDSEFKEYILIDQSQVHIEQFSKTPEGNWLLTESDAEDKILNLVSAKCQISHRQIYERVKLE
jgi:hypothetical protein